MLDRVRKTSKDIAIDLDFELVDVEYIKEHGNYFLRIYIDKTGGVDLDDCQKMSENLSEKLDEEDPIKTEYFLEVSSPGLDRPLKTDRDLKRNLNKDIEIRLYSPYKNKKNYEGELEDYTEENIILKENENIIEIPRENISLIRLSIKF